MSSTVSKEGCNNTAAWISGTFASSTTTFAESSAINCLRLSVEKERKGLAQS